jgi:hypothetical protein
MTIKYEIHVNAYEIGDEVRSELLDLGFYEDDFIQDGLTHAPPNHFTSILYDDPSGIRDIWKPALEMVKADSEFQGYIESETVPLEYRSQYEGGKFEDIVPFPFAPSLNPLELGPGRFKASDIHIERDLHLPRDGLDQLLLDHNFYEVHWQGENEAERIYTLQSEWFGDAKLAYAKLKDYFDQVGGIKQLDLEITTDFHRKPEGFPVAKVIPKGHIAES